MKALTFTLRTRQPLLIPSHRPGNENSAKSMAYIPGSILRGLFIQRYTQEQTGELDAAEAEFRRLFLDGSVRYLNAYPVDYQGNRSLPTPLSWRMSKADKGKECFAIIDFAVAEDNDALAQPTPISQHPFCQVDNEGDVFFPKPTHIMRYHNASQKRMAKGKGESTVFSYEAIAPGEAFAAAVLAEDEADLEKLEQLLERSLNGHLGKSRKAGYGMVDFEEIKVIPDWREYLPSDEEDEHIILTLLSDAILRDPDTGQWASDLSKVFGKKVQDAFIATTVVGGINNKWGLPLPQVPALRAGSVFVFSPDAFSTEERQQLVTHGIGERQAEGFGRIAIQWQGQKYLKAYTAPDKREPSKSISLTPRSQTLAQRMAERMLRAELDRCLLDALAGLEISGEISNAQLSRLRLAARRAQEAGSWMPMQEFLSKDNLKSTARRQLERAKVGHDRLLTWLGQAVTVDKKGAVTDWTLWKQYFAKGEEPTRKVDGVEVKANNAMKLEYTLRLIDALLHKTSKKGGKA